MNIKKSLFISLILSAVMIITSLNSWEFDAAMCTIPPNVVYDTHCEKIGWQVWQQCGNTSGTIARSKRIECIKIKLDDLTGDYLDSHVEYRVHCQSYGWMSWVKDGALAGTTGQAKRIEAINIRLQGSISNDYDIYYRVHVQKHGWMPWVKNGELAGTTGQKKRIEAIQIMLVEKN